CGAGACAADEQVQRRRGFADTRAAGSLRRRCEYASVVWQSGHAVGDLSDGKDDDRSERGGHHIRPPRLERDCRGPISWNSTWTLVRRVRAELRCRAHRMRGRRVDPAATTRTVEPENFQSPAGTALFRLRVARLELEPSVSPRPTLSPRPLQKKRR